MQNKAFAIKQELQQKEAAKTKEVKKKAAEGAVKAKLMRVRREAEEAEKAKEAEVEEETSAPSDGQTADEQATQDSASPRSSGCREGDDSAAEASVHTVRSYLLSFWDVSLPAPPELKMVRAIEDEDSYKPPHGFSRPSALSMDGASDRALFGTRTPVAGRDRRTRDRRQPTRGVEEPAVLPSPSANAFRRVEAASKEEELTRSVQSLLNKICPENVRTIAEKIVALNVSSVAELQLVIGLIKGKALAESHYCETYADLVFYLRPVLPTFPSTDGKKPTDVKKALLNVCQAEFENMQRTSLENDLPKKR